MKNFARGEKRNRNKRLHTIHKKRVHKERKETTHGEIGERTVITTSNVCMYVYIYIYIYIYKQVQGLLSQSKKHVSKK